MMRYLLLAVIAVAWMSGCKKEARPVEGPPLRIEFGDCIASGTFVSGPRPAPFDEGRLAVLAKPEPEPEPEPEPDDLDEGKMGKQDSTREVGQYEILARGLDGQLTTLTGTGEFSSGFDDQDIGDGEMQGGFGFGSDGSGAGGGTGWGTFGTGGYGTIGHGSGTGTGYGPGGMRGRRQYQPQVRIGVATVEGDLDKSIIRRYIRRKLAQIKHCYEKQLLVDPTLSGTVATKFTILPNGAPSSIEASGVSDEVSSCVAQVFRSIQFPKPKGGGMVQVTYPFTFRSGAEASPAAAPQAAAGAADYVPGADNPLRAQGTALETCFRKRKQTYGVSVLEMSFGDGGVVASATAHGDLGDALSSCLADAAKQARWEAAAGSTKRCSIAVGTAPLDQPLGSPNGAVPLVDIDAENLTYRGAPVTRVAALVQREGPEWKIERLFDLARAEIVRHGSLRDAVVVTGPTVIRPVGATPMKVVLQAERTLAAAGVDAGLAAQRDGSWKQLRPVELPVVPVPRGTGVAWNHPGSGRIAMAAIGETPQLSILVTPTDYWVGVSSVQYQQRIPRTDPAAATAGLRDALAELAKAGYRQGRTDVQLGAEDAISYAEFLVVFDVVTAFGLTDWQLRRPEELSARFLE